VSFADGSQRLPARRRDQPGLQFFRLLYIVQFLKESCEYILKNLGSLIFVEPRPKGNCIYQALVTQYQPLPCKLITASAS
jgi:hypothetical protein